MSGSNTGDILTPEVGYAIVSPVAQCALARRSAAEFTRGDGLLASYDLIKIKLAFYYLLLYVVYICQKSLNFVDAFNCYKQKSKLAPFNVAHPVHHPVTEEGRSRSITREVLSIHIKLHCLSKTLEWLVACQLINHLSEWKLLAEVRSAYRAHHSMETACSRRH